MRNFPGAPTLTVFQVWDNDVTFLLFAFSDGSRAAEGGILGFSQKFHKGQPTKLIVDNFV